MGHDFTAGLLRTAPEEWIGLGRAIRHSDMPAVVTAWHSRGAPRCSSTEALVGCELDGTNREIV